MFENGARPLYSKLLSTGQLAVLHAGCHVPTDTSRTRVSHSSWARGPCCVTAASDRWRGC